MSYETIVYENVEDRIVRLTLNRPEKLNAMSPTLLADLDGALGEFERDRQASVLIIRGAGRAFCAGYDLAAPPATDGGPFTITEDRVSIGRSPDAGVFLDDVTVSRNHALLVRRRDGLYIDDLGSLNGTYVNRRRIESHLLADGDEIQVGKYKLSYLEN